MATLVANYTNFCPPSSTTVLKSGTGKIHAIFATSLSTTPATIAIYDNTSGSGNLLFSFQVAAPQPVCIVLPNYLALRFYVGLTVVTPASVYCYLVTEESEESFIPPIADFVTYHCRVYNNAAISIPHNVYTAVTFNTEQSDTGNMHSTLSNTSRITFPSSGFYVVGGSFIYLANATGVRHIALRLNGSTFINYHHLTNLGAGSDQGMSIATGYEFALDDYLELVAYQTSGGGLNITIGTTPPTFWAAKVL